MKKLLSLSLLVGIAALVACGPSAKEKAEKAKQDSIAIADSIAQQAKIDSITTAAAQKARLDSIAIAEAEAKAKAAQYQKSNPPKTEPSTPARKGDKAVKNTIRGRRS
jgi:spermidine/putrescine-binding protein